MGRWLELDSLDNQNISSALLIGTYTASADIDVYCTLYAQGLAGGGDYVYYVTVTPSGLSEGEALKTTQTLGATTYVLFGQTIPVSLRNGDAMKVYIDGLAGDTTTPDTRVNFYESPSLQPTTAGRTLDVDANGGAEVGSFQTDAIAAAAIKADAVTKIAAGVLAVALTESYAADGAAPTLTQAILAIQQFLQERDVTSATVTVKKLDGAATAMTFTLNDALSPTSITRAT